MIYFFKKSASQYYAVGTKQALADILIDRLTWLFSGATLTSEKEISGNFIGPRREMITPWSTNAVEIAQNAGIVGIERIESFKADHIELPFDPMLQQRYYGLHQDLFTLEVTPAPVLDIEDIQAYNEKESLALSEDEVLFLEHVVAEIGRPLTDSEIFGFSQINSEHCRHKIFNGEFIIDGEKQELSLFQWIKKTSKDHPNFLVSAYKDNVAFIQGPVAEQFAPATQDKPDYFETKDFESVISLKAETHNFPTTVEPFNGAATGSGGEIRDRMAGGQGSIPLAGTAVYMTSYPRTKGADWEKQTKERPWLYQTPKEILIKASNGASDYGNKFGQPLICGSLLTFEYEDHDQVYGFDKVIMLAGGIGFGKLKESKKQAVAKDQQIVVLGGDNYRIGMGGGAVSSVDTGEFANAIELNAVQRANPEMQKRVANTVRAMTELEDNPVVSIHDHGAGGHLNCLSELVEESGGVIDVKSLPIGDPTLSDKELMSNESQERMGLIIDQKNLDYLKAVAARERSPYYEVGTTTGDMELKFNGLHEKLPFDLKLDHLFGSSPKTVLEDEVKAAAFRAITYDTSKIESYLKEVLQLEAVASKDWLTNKVDRCVTGKVATQQTVGEIQVPLNNVAVMAIDYKNLKGIATGIGHSPVPGMINAGAGSRLSVTECLTNMVFAPLTHGLGGISLSANWMWPAKNPGENARLYEGVKAISEFVSELGINIPTGKDSLSMTQKYKDGQKVLAPGTVIVSGGAEVSDIRKTILPAVKTNAKDAKLIYVPFGTDVFELGGSSFAQVAAALGQQTPDVAAATVIKAFNLIQQLINDGSILAGHDVSAGGLITTLLEMNFPNQTGGIKIDLAGFEESDLVKLLFSENPAVVLQVKQSALATLKNSKVDFIEIGAIQETRQLSLSKGYWHLTLDIDDYRTTWMRSSHLLDLEQTATDQAQARFEHFGKQPLSYRFPEGFTGKYSDLNIDVTRKARSGVKAAIIREQGVNSDREMAYALFMAGFDVLDVHMTDLVSGRADLSDVNMIVFVGGFSNSDVLGSAKGWAGSFLFNEKAKTALDNFYARPDTLSLGVCNGCQLMMELEVVFPEMENHPKMHHNVTGKFECGFINVDIEPNNTVMLGNMAGSRLGIWLAHGEGRFMIDDESPYNIPMKYSYDAIPGNPNGSSFGAAAMASKDGRHLAIMPHLERSLFPWNWAHYEDKQAHEVSPWLIPFANAFEWVKSNT